MTEPDLAAEAFGLPVENLWTALLAVQGEAIRIQKNAEAEVQTKTGRTYKYKFATLALIHEHVLPVLTKYGLLWRTLPSLVDGKPALAYSMMHVATGGAEEGVMSLALGANAGPQEQGSGLSFARRYALMSVLNLVPTETDDDGARANRSEDRKLSEANRVKVLDELGAAVGKWDLFVASVGVSSVATEWTRSDALKIRAALDKRKANQ